MERVNSEAPAIRPYDFTEPKVRFQTPPGVFENIRDILLDSNSPSKSSDLFWYRSGLSSNSPLIGAMKDVTETALECLHASGHVNVVRIHYTFDANPVRPKVVQRIGEWHRDGSEFADDEEPEKILDVIVASDNQPTVTAVAPTPLRIADHSMLHEYINLNSDRDFQQTAKASLLISRGITAGLLKAHQPDSGQAVSIMNNFHRSPKNESNERIQRVFWRIIAVGTTLQ